MQKLLAETKYSVEGVEAVKVSIMSDDGSITVRTISVPDFINLMYGGVRLSGAKIDLRIGKLPKGFLDGTVSTDNSYKVMLHVPAHSGIMRHYENRFLIPFPDLVFFLNVRKEGFAEGECYALKDGNTDDEALLYHYPFGNVSANGRICFGNIFQGSTFAENHGISQSHHIVAEFFDAITNDDYWGSKFLKDYPFKRQLDLLKAIDKKPVFPSEYLVSCGKSMASLYGML